MILASKNKPKKQQSQANLHRTAVLYNKVMLEAIFSVLEQKRILTRDEVEKRASEILHKTCPDPRWLQ